MTYLSGRAAILDDKELLERIGKFETAIRLHDGDVVEQARADLIARLVEILSASGSVMASTTSSCDDRELLHRLADYMEGVCAAGPLRSTLRSIKLAQAERLHVLADQQPRRCRFCSCSEQQACPGGCSWISLEPAICSRCA